MTFAIGSRLGSFEILSSLGAGGMGEVYKARDTRLDRTVAIKILAAPVAADPHFRERFDREARVIAALNHPHICTLHDVGRHDGVDFLVMEYVEGQTLAERLPKGPLPLDQVLQYAMQIADALDAAHRHGIVHRDLKPANVMLTKNGVKLLDFGLAKTRTTGAVAGLSLAATMPGPLTEQGAILGTLHSMSPEQVEGKDTDARSDLFAFGALVYEMATGKRAFEGQSAASVMAAILERDPPAMASLQPITPPLLDHVVSRCLVKDPDRRWQSALDIVHELRWIADTGPRATPAGAATQSRRPWIWIAATAVCLVAAVGVFALHVSEAPRSSPVLRYSIALPKEGDSDGLHFNFHISPNGRFVAVSAVLEQTFGIFVRALDSQEFRLLAGTNDSDFSWSPDSESIGFFDEDGYKLKKVRVSGGPAEEICDIDRGGYFYDSHGSWSRDALIVFAIPRGGPLFVVPATGGKPRPVTTPSAGESHTFPVFLPDGRHFLYTSRGGADPGVYLASLDNGAGRRLLADQSSVTFAPAAPGEGLAHLIFMREGKLMAQRLDPKALELAGDAFVLVESALLDDSGAAAVSVSNNGVLGYLSGRSREFDSRLTWFDRSGKTLATEGAAGPPAQAALSPDDKTVVVLRRQAGSQTGDLWLRELSRGLETRFTTDNTVSGLANVVWSPDGSEIAFSSVASGSVDIFKKDIRATKPSEPLVRNENNKVLTEWSRTGFLLYTELRPQTGADLWYLRVDGGAGTSAAPVPFAQTKYHETLGQISPDGRWIAYVSNESGDYEVYVRPFPSGPGKWRISKSEVRHVGSTTTQPRWSPDGKELFYLTGPVGRFTLMAVPLKAGLRLAPGSASEFDFDPPRPLFQVRANTYGPTASTFFYMVSKDSQRFLIDHVESAAEPALNMVVNWEQAFGGK
jgi:serine/threonine protein kinase/WD40 repeat protein